MLKKRTFIFESPRAHEKQIRYFMSPLILLFVVLFLLSKRFFVVFNNVFNVVLLSFSLVLRSSLFLLTYSYRPTF